MNHSTHVVLSIGVAGSKLVVRDNNTEEVIYEFSFSPADIIIEVAPADRPKALAWMSIDHILELAGIHVGNTNGRNRP